MLERIRRIWLVSSCCLELPQITLPSPERALKADDQGWLHVVRADCNGELDLAFLMDSSGSIMSSDYSLQLNFVAQVVNALPVASGKVQVANVVFGTLAKVAFMFNTYTDKQDILDDIRHTDKGQDRL